MQETTKKFIAEACELIKENVLNNICEEIEIPFDKNCRALVQDNGTVNYEANGLEFFTFKSLRDFALWHFENDTSVSFEYQVLLGERDSEGEEYFNEPGYENILASKTIDSGQILSTPINITEKERHYGSLPKKNALELYKLFKSKGFLQRMQFAADFNKNDIGALPIVSGEYAEPGSDRYKNSLDELRYCAVNETLNDNIVHKRWTKESLQKHLLEEYDINSQLHKNDGSLYDDDDMFAVPINDSFGTVDIFFQEVPNVDNTIYITKTETYTDRV